uniref:RNA/RNP complex-1-interacting phosphatase isoform X2 n=1 Tax=Gasterosteus aculeatus aculeatus TaxID=481459 RepID=UPI001A982492|nr:RNA/RNP complex-1-interacting phosphatase isoform X2 [Gasterosteus aculeatus aculeatus]
MPRHGVPLRWLDYSAVGKRLNGTRFIAFKVPLKQSLNQQLPSSDVFGLWELLDTLKREDQELGLIIDLTFTTRYYSLQDVPDSLLVMKIFTAGHEVPSNKTILSFKRAVGAFLRDHADNDMLIGVHCTHGLNRTGYLICRYLIDVDGMDPKEAVALFNSSRGHAMERQNYLDDLLRGPKRRSVSNSNEGMQEAEQEPMRGLASQRRLSAPPLKDHRPFPPRGASQRSHKHHLNFPSPSMGAPPPSYQWRTSHADSQWRSPPCSEGSRSRYAHPDHRRARYGPPGDSRSRNAHPDPRRLKYASPLDSRSRNALQRSAGLDMLLQRIAVLDMLFHRTAGLDMLPPEGRGSRYAPPESRGSRYAPPEDSGSRYAPPEDRGSRYAPPEDRGSRYAPPEDRGSRYAPPEDRGSRYAPPEDSGSRYAPPEVSGSRYAPPEGRGSRYAPPEGRGSRYAPPEGRGSRYAPPEVSGSRYAPPEDSGSRYAPPEENRLIDPTCLPRYSACWTNESVETDWSWLNLKGGVPPHKL